MRKCDPKPKREESVVMPEELLKFMQYVNECIVTEDECATLESDDLLQCDCVYGGLIEEGGDEYGFTYFPEEGTRHKWEFLLKASDIAEIAGGRIDRLTLWACTDPICHCKFWDASETCFYCDYIDDEPSQVLPSEQEEVQYKSKEEFVRSFLKNNPSPHPFEVIGAYNGHEYLGERLGWFTIDEVTKLIERIKGESS